MGPERERDVRRLQWLYARQIDNLRFIVPTSDLCEVGVIIRMTVTQLGDVANDAGRIMRA